MGRGVLYVLALLFLFLGILGAFIPGMPTTVFILMSAWAAARSSPRLHEWLRQHRLFGPSLRNWEAGGYVSRKGKRMAALTMLACALIMVLVGVPLWALITASSCMAIVGTWLWFRPEPPEHLTQETKPH
ncbi:membrane protein [Lampropedia cohaerens]|uniref:Membrane protein n=1 Tax=Lampropedia cohaerens TaxID=1610491 RepID=A0A0U1PXA8_9BURK|nr:membrane protein [Lampropedia cohaerens]